MKNLLFAVLSSLLLPILALSQWSTNPAVNNPINTTTGEQAIPKIATCPNGDSYIAFFSNESGNYNVQMQRLDAQGNLLWEPNGILISDHEQMGWLTDWDMTADADNHAILTFQDIRNGGNNNVVAYRIAPDGSFIWGPDGIALSNSTAFNVSPKVTVTSEGNAVFAWMADDVTIMQKVSPAGTLLWGPAGITLSGFARYTWPQLMPVGDDEVIMKYFEDTGPVNAPTRHVYAQRYDADGNPVWSSPAAISTAGGITAWTQIFPFINDGNDGFYIAWHDDRDNNMLFSTFVQHIKNTGEVLFQANGVEASTMGNRHHFYPHIALPPGSSDVYVFWNEMDSDQILRGIYGQKLTSSGTSLWAASGKVFIEISSLNVYPFAARNTPTDVVLFFEEYYNSVNGQLKAMRIDANGDYIWTPSFKTICSVNSEKVHVEVNEFADNQWILSWEDTRNSGRDIYAQNIQLDGSLGPYIPTEGTIEGLVTLSGGIADMTETTITAGTHWTNPDAGGHYSLTIEAGTYTVIASHPYALSDSLTGIVVEAGQTISNINFELEIIRGDLVCKAVDTYNNILNDVNVEITGPEGVYNGTVTNDSLIFENLPYGAYNGSAWMEGVDPVYANAEMGEFDHDIIFVFDFTGIGDGQSLSADAMLVSPNPFSGNTVIAIQLKDPSVVSLKIYSQKGQLIRTLLDGSLESRPHQIAWNGKSETGRAVTPGLYTAVLQTKSGRQAKVVIRMP